MIRFWSMQTVKCSTEGCGSTITFCAVCDPTWVRRAHGWANWAQGKKWACRKCCDGWGPTYSLQKCAAGYLAEPFRVCVACRPEWPDSLTAATSDTQPPAVPCSGAAGGGVAEGGRQARKNAATSMSGDWLWWNSNDWWWGWQSQNPRGWHW